jgi:hypothetical protein
MRLTIAIITAALLMLVVSTSALHAAAASATSPSPEKQWAADLPAFLNERPGNWIVGHSREPALSAAEAESFACRDAAASLFDKLRPRVPRSSWPVLRKRIDAVLAGGDWVVDRQIKSDARPYATIWSGAVLIDASAERRDRLVRDVEREARQQRERTVAGTAGATMIAVVVGSIYLLLNWLTRGFFRARLLTASLLVVAGGICGIVHLI